MNKKMYAIVLSGAVVLGCGGPSRQATPVLPEGQAVSTQDGKPAAEGDTSWSVPAQPEKQVLTFPEGEEFRKAQPGAGKTPQFKAPRPATFKLSSGINVHLIERNELPVVSMSLSFPMGEMHDPAGKEGLSSVCMNLLTEGTKKKDKVSYASAQQDLASRIYSYSADDESGIGMNTLSRNFDATFALFRENILEPAARPEDFGRLVKLESNGLIQERANPAQLAQKITGKVYWGEKHPRGRYATPESVGALTTDDCLSHFSSVLKPKGANLFVVGNIDKAKIVKAFSTLSDWKGAGKKAARVPKASSAKGRLFFVDVPGAAQSAIRIVHSAPKANHSSAAALQLLSGVLGSNFTSRVNMNLREDKGYTYGARASFWGDRDYGVFTASTTVRGNSTYQSLVEIRNEIDGLKSGKVPPKEEELTREKNGAVQSLPAKFSTASSILQTYRQLVSLGLPMSFHETHTKKVAKTSTSKVKQAARRYLTPDRAVYVVIGDGSTEMIERKDGKDQPMVRAGKPVTLRDALKMLVESGKLGRGGFVELTEKGELAKK